MRNEQKGLQRKEDVVRVPCCTYLMEEKEPFFFLCSCQKDQKVEEEEFFPICLACRWSCHPEGEGHQITKHEGKYNCKCGEKKHMTRSAVNEPNSCFFSRFENIISQPPVYLWKDEEEAYCDLCYKICKGKGELVHVTEKRLLNQTTCKCTDHQSVGVLNIEKTVEFIKTNKEDLPNFNINFFLVDSDFQQKTIFYFSNRISKALSLGGNSEEFKYFFKDYKMYKILNTFHDLREHFKNDNVTLNAEAFLKVKEGFAELDKDKIRDTSDDLLMCEVDDNNLEDSEFKIICESKILFAQFLYYLSYHPYFIKFNNDCLNQYSIANMNLIQRYIYIHQFKSFWQYSVDYKMKRENEDVEAIREMIRDLTRFSTVVVKLFDNLTEKREFLQLELIEKSFQLYNSLVKTMIKRGLLSDEDTKVYFESVYKTLKKLEDDAAERFSFTIVKNIYYALLYNNDRLLIKQFKGEQVKESEFSHFSSKENERNDIINKVFLKILNIKSRKCPNNSKNENLSLKHEKTKSFHTLHQSTMFQSKNEKINKEWRKKFLRFDYYVNRILDMSVGSSNGNRLSVYNIKHLDNINGDKIARDLHEIFSNSEYFRKYLTNIEEDSNQKKPYHQIIVEIADEMLEANKYYLQYRKRDISSWDFNNSDCRAFKRYMIKFENNIKNLKKLINNELKSIPSPKVNIFMESCGESSEENNKKIDRIKNAVKFSNFFQAVNGFIRIYSENKDKWQWKEQIPDWEQHINFLFRFLFMFIKDEDNNKLDNLIFLSMLDLKAFVATFEDDKHFNDFVVSLNELHFGKIVQEYKFDNFIFMEKLVSQIIMSTDEKRVKYELRKADEDKFKETKKLILGMRVARKMIRSVSYKEASQLNILELLKVKVFNLFSDKTFKNEILFQLDDNSKFQEQNRKNVQTLLNRYFILCNEVLKNDLSFFDILNEEQFITLEEAKQLLSFTIKMDKATRPLLNDQNGMLLTLSIMEYLSLKQYYIPYNINSTRISNLLKPIPAISSSGKNNQNLYHFIRDNLSLSNLGDYPKILNGTNVTRSDYIQVFHGALREKVMMLLEDIKIFQALVGEGYINKIKSLIIKRAAVMSYFENGVMRPCYSLINQFLFFPSEIYNVSLKLIRDLVKEFLECLKKLWEVISRADSLRDDQREVDTFKKFDLLNQEMLFKPDESKFGEVMNKLSKYAEKIEKKYQFYQIKKFVKVLNYFVKEYTRVDKEKEKMFSHKEKEVKDIIDESIHRDVFLKNNKTLMMNLDKFFFKPEDTEKAENISLIRVVKEVDSEEVRNLGENLFEYLFKMVNDEHAVDYYKEWQNYEFPKHLKTSKDEIGIHKAKNHYFLVQRLGFFRIMNKLFEMDYSTYQDIIKSYFSNLRDSEKSFDHFLKMCVNFNIVSISIFECKKYYQIKRPIPLGSLTLETAKNTIKFFQNLCEGHNLYFQDKLFKMKAYEFNRCTDKSEKKRENDFDEVDFESYIIDPKIFREVTGRDFNSNKLEGYRDFKGEGVSIIKYLNEIKEKDDLDKYLEEKFTFINFVFVTLKLTVMHSHYSDTITDLFDNQLREVSSLEIIRERIHELILEMIQGTREENFLKIYDGFGVKNVDFADELNDFANDFKKYNNVEVEKFSFLKYMLEVRYIYNQQLEKKKVEEGKKKKIIVDTGVRRIFDDHYKKSEEENHLTSEELFKQKIEKETTKLIHYSFRIINTIIGQQSKKEEGLYKSILNFFPLDALLKISVNYLIKIAKKYKISQIDILNDESKHVVFNKEVMGIFFENFKSQEIMFEDELFKLPSQIFLFVTIVFENFDHFETRQLMKKVLEVKETEYKKKNGEFEEPKEITEVKEKITSLTLELQNHHNKAENNAVHDEFEEENRAKEVFDNNKIHTVIFFRSLIKKVEFLIKNSEGRSIPKIIYFLTNPKTYQISNATLQSFIDNVDRKSATTKLKGLMSEIEMFKSEVDFKDKNKEGENKPSGTEREINKSLEFKYINVDIFNFSVSCLINLILLLFMQDEEFVNTFTFKIIILLSLIQIGINLFYIYIFFDTKFTYILNIEVERTRAKNKKELVNPQLRMRDWIDIYLFKCILHEDIALFYFNVLVLVICLYSKFAIFLYPLLLFSVIKFIPIIKDVVVAFQLSYRQILEMIGFLAILIYFYANLGFFFMTNEFNMTLDAGQTNMCGSLLECFITYFNFGIRAGGGIGDVLGPKSYKDSEWFWIRWITDMIFYITVILLIMNMINGIIITTFSTKRKIKEENEQDQENKCFICSQHKIKFISVKKDFDLHIKSEHNYKNYIRYFFVIKSTNEKQLDADQSYIKQCMEMDDIGFFPVAESLYLPKTSDTEEEED